MLNMLDTANPSVCAHYYAVTNVLGNATVLMNVLLALWSVQFLVLTHGATVIAKSYVHHVHSRVHGYVRMARALFRAVVLACAYLATSTARKRFRVVILAPRFVGKSVLLLGLHVLCALHPHKKILLLT
jgi:hypothetical protein